MKRLLPGALILLFQLFAVYSYATLYTSAADGSWGISTNWSPNGIPGATDSVVINGHDITIDITTPNISVLSVFITNTNNSKLILDGAITLTVDQDFTVHQGMTDMGIDIDLINDARLMITGNADFTRMTNSDKNLKLSILDNSFLQVTGDFTYDYQSAASNEGETEIFLDDTGELKVLGDTYFYHKGGASFDLEIWGFAKTIFDGNLLASKSGGDDLNIISRDQTSFHVGGNAELHNTIGMEKKIKFLAAGSHGKISFGGDLVMTSDNAAGKVYLEADKANSVIDVRGDITMDATGASDVFIELKSSSNFYMGGNFYRPNDYGALFMNGNATLTYNGTVNPQELAPKEIDGSDTDAFNYSNVVFNNEHGFVLTDTFVVEDNFDLSNGKIVTDSSKILIISDNATITGGSETAYVDGPMIKRGQTNGAPFVFPVGDESGYAPIEISKLTSVTSEFRAQFLSDPPPFGNNFTEGSPMNNMSGGEYWNLERISGTEPVYVTLHWMDATASGINNTNDLMVVGLNESNEWSDYGQGAITTSGSSGSITSAVESDPPPFGNNFSFTFGSISALNSLPVELTKFHTIQEEDQVYLEWQIASEINTNYYQIERSTDGRNFYQIGVVTSKGDTKAKRKYSFFDSSASFGENYYRLRIVDFDDSYEFSPIRMVDFAKELGFKVFPNPVDKTLKIEAIDKEWTSGQMQVFDRTGQLLYEGEIDVDHGVFEISTEEINIQRGGLYYLIINTNSRSRILKFLKLE